MRRNYYHDFKFLEGVLEWYFGPRVSLSYRYIPGDPQKLSPLIAINGEIMARGSVPVNQILKYIENMGIERSD